MTVPTFTKSGTKATNSAKLDTSIFKVNVVHHQLLKDAYLAYLADGRGNFAQTKTRGKVQGGGRKPWRQKGTGSARAGSRRSPIWRGGGITFGPTGQENYAHKLNTKAKQQALRQALSLAAIEGRIKIVETFDCPDGKVKLTLKLLDKIGAQGFTLLVVSLKDSLVVRATSNLPKVKAIQASYLTVYDILNADHIVISRKALDMIQEWLGGNK